VERVPTPRDLSGAAVVAQSLAYTAGIAGVIAGALLYRDGETPFAIVVWVLTFAVGAILMIAAFLARGMSALLGRLARIEQDVGAVLARDRPEPEPERDPWARHRSPY
jgi:hypothetical protein